MIDLHCHLLPAIDDGPAELAGALAQAGLHLNAGVGTVVCTPHVSHGYRNSSASIRASLEAFAAALERAGLDLQVLPGAEVSLSRAVEIDDDELTALHLGQGPWLLLEPPLASDVPRLEQLVAGIHARGHQILVAHPERCAAFHRDRDLLPALVRAGAAVQLTAGSLSGQFGRTVRKLALDMIDAELVHVVSSDAHDPENRSPGLSSHLANAGLDGLVDWACADVPLAMLDGRPLPPRPIGIRSGSRRKGFFGRR